MSKRKYSAKFKIYLMKLYYESHWSFTDLRQKYHVGMLSLQDWNNLVKFWGYSALRAHSQRRFSIKFRLRVVKYYLRHHEGCSKVAGRFKITHTHVQKWTNK